MKYYKLTDKNNKTANNTVWGEGVAHKAVGKGKQLCSGDVIHVYDHPLKAVMFNPIHASFEEYKLWEVHVRKVVANDGLKVGVKRAKTIKEVGAPRIAVNQRVCFAIYCALLVCKDKAFTLWANNWLSGEDRTAEAAEAVARVAAGAAARSAEAAARSAEAATWAATRAATWAATRVATWAATRVAAEAATRVAAEAAEAVARVAEAASLKEIDFVHLIKKAMKEEKQ